MFKGYRNLQDGSQDEQDAVGILLDGREYHQAVAQCYMPPVWYIHEEKWCPTYRMKQHLKREHKDAQKMYLQMLKDEKIEKVTYFV